MGLSQRLSKLFQADMHGLLDRLEEPELALRQAVREMEELVQHDQAEVQRYTRHEAALQRRLRDTKDGLEKMSRELDLCFANGRDDLAESFVRRKLESQKLIVALDKKIAEQTVTIKDKKEQLAQRTEHLEVIRRKVEIFMEESRINDVFTNPENTSTNQLHVTDEEVAVALMREKQDRQGGKQ